MSDNEDKRISKNSSFRQSLKLAIYGIYTAIKEERNMRFHMIALVAVIIASLIFQLTPPEWLWILLAVTLVIVAEMINSMVERIVDLVVGKIYHDQAKIIKDMAAGAVLICTIFSVAVGLIVFGPKLVNILFK